MEPDTAELHNPGELLPVELQNLNAQSRNSPAACKNGDPEVLVVEDNADLRAFIVQKLSASYFTMEAVDGREGMQLAQERIPDLIISDLMMPEMGGCEMCSILKEDPRTSHIPIIMLTAKADKQSKLEGLETGADDYLVKPFDTEELQVRIRNLIIQRERLRVKFRQEFSLKTNGDIPISPNDQLLQQILDIFEEQLSDSDFSMDQLSELLNLSRAQLFRKVQALTGFTPNDFLRKIRLKRAAELLDNGHRNVSQVMYQVGFNNQSYFAKCFKELYKVNPSEYKKATSI
jgi:DNA-binding response OmpR family regulator